MKVQESLVSSKNTTSGRMLGCYILCNEILVEVNQMTVEVEVDRHQVKVEVDRQQVEVKVDRHQVEVEVDRQQVEVEVDRQQVKGPGSRLGKFEVKDINDNSNEKRSK
jgi:hypothetical protein